MKEGGMGKYLVCFVVVLRVVLGYLGFLFVDEVAGEVFGAEFFAPFLVVDEPIPISTSILSLWEETYIVLLN